ncbi:hypothetical protein SBA_ch1_27950 [Sphingomonas bisphenolicum]|uniref:Uncharacterized protein n=1 Tax=Sphingomonas bisphenolicum TaxID=296544 RepID=A0ABM7G702_9SPHN|nr:hypothetical protein SBA_ch1_27950 [Sphingomonas bisphenolicum]
MDLTGGVEPRRVQVRFPAAEPELVGQRWARKIMTRTAQEEGGLVPRTRRVLEEMALQMTAGKMLAEAMT